MKKKNKKKRNIENIINEKIKNTYNETSEDMIYDSFNIEILEIKNKMKLYNNNDTNNNNNNNNNNNKYKYLIDKETQTYDIIKINKLLKEYQINNKENKIKIENIELLLTNMYNIINNIKYHNWTKWIIN